jgi:methylenetetrahydrofolate reductase (NADPH)
MRDEGMFQSGRKITNPPRIFLGAAANPFVPPYEFRPARLAKKVAAGAQFVQTQYCFDIDRLKQFMASVRQMGLHEQVFILVGVGPLASARAAEWIRSNVPGVHIPDPIIERLKGSENQKAEGRKICVELIQQIREIEGVSGVHVMAYRQEEAVAEIIQQSGVLGSRKPWSP